MTEEKINMQVELFNEGNDKAVEVLAKLLLPIISKHSKEIWYEVDEAEFECRCVTKIKHSLKTFNPKKGRLLPRAIAIIEKEKRDFLKRRKRREVENEVQIDKPLIGKDGDEVFVEIEDHKANIEKNKEAEERLKEKISLLAKGDPRRIAILNEWTYGSLNDIELSRELALSYKGNSESHRKFIQRFRTECKERLETIL